VTRCPSPTPLRPLWRIEIGAKPILPLTFALLRHLSDGEIHSGDALAAGIGMTRARVSQLLKQVEASGLALERLHGRGYRLIDATPLLDRAAIVAALPAHAADLTIEVVDTVDSTNNELLRRAPGGNIDRHLLAAEWQTAGRGRRGRRWTAVAGGSLTFSLGWRFEQGAAHLAGLSLAVAVALCRVLESRGYEGIELKWPNDLLHRQRKLGGILIDLSGDALGPSLVVIGVGLNVLLPERARRDIAQPVTDLATIAGPCDRNALLASIAAELASLLERYACEGFASFREEWQGRHAFQDQPVQVLVSDGSIARGRAVGVDADGALVLERRGHRQRFVTGEVSVRRVAR
jgi:BirA family transcriptional regulator, biotin operon repressor / biotin---[acetyl-CoA-carboxylase] ligase